MTALPTVPAALAVGDKITATWLNQNQAWTAFTAAPPSCKLYRVAALNFTTATLTVVPWDTEIDDNTGMHDLVTNVSRVTAVYPGRYEFKGQVGFSANATGTRQVLGYLNGVAVPQDNVQVGPSTTGSTLVPFAFTERLNVGDYFEIYGNQTSGGTLTVVGNATSVSAVWIGS